MGIKSWFEARFSLQKLRRLLGVYACSELREEVKEQRTLSTCAAWRRENQLALGPTITGNSAGADGGDTVVVGAAVQF